MAFLFLGSEDYEQQHREFVAQVQITTGRIAHLQDQLGAGEEVREGGLLNLAAGMAEVEKRVQALRDVTEPTWWSGETETATGPTSGRSSRITSRQPSFRDSPSETPAGTPDLAPGSPGDPRRQSLLGMRRSSSSSGRRLTRKSVMPSDKQELTQVARKMAQADPSSTREDEKTGRKSERTESNEEDGQDVPEYFARDEEGELSKYLSGMFTGKAEAEPQRGDGGDADTGDKEGARRPHHHQEKRLPAFESTLKVIGLDFVFGDTPKPAPASRTLSYSPKRPLEPLAERVFVSNPIKVESLFSSFTLYTVTLDKRGVSPFLATLTVWLGL